MSMIILAFFPFHEASVQQAVINMPPSQLNGKPFKCLSAQFSLYQRMQSQEPFSVAQNVNARPNPRVNNNRSTASERP